MNMYREKRKALEKELLRLRGQTSESVNISKDASALEELTSKHEDLLALLKEVSCTHTNTT